MVLVDPGCCLVACMIVVISFPGETNASIPLDHSLLESLARP